MTTLHAPSVPPEMPAAAVPTPLVVAPTVAAALADASPLSTAERVRIIDQASVLLRDNYVHLRLKEAMHAADPVQRLRLLRVRVERADAEGTPVPERAFHSEMSRIFHSVRDLHTNYLLPEPYARLVAFLPFQVEEYTEDGARRHVVTRLVGDAAPAGLEVGAEVTYWNGMPIATAVAVQADRFAGSNPAARRSRGVESLTIRPLRIHLPPDESWVTVGFVTAAGHEAEVRVPWRVMRLGGGSDADGAEGALSVAAAAEALDLAAELVGRAKARMFVPEVVTAAAQPVEELVVDGVRADGSVPTSMPTVFRARRVETAHGPVGHIRIFTFSVDAPQAFVAEFVRLASLLPQDGLVLDVRGNGGGHIHASEFLLQTLTPGRITPEPVQFSVTDLNRRICARHADDPTGQIDLGPWSRSLDQAVETGAVYSASHPITPVDGANAIGQTYHGPVVLVIDARCYSATDIFAAGFADHGDDGIGPILGVDETTGAGGANVWTHGLLSALMQLPTPDPWTPYAPLPRGADMRVSIRRTLRVGELAGTPVEDLGVEPTDRHAMTRRDVLEGNADLLDAAAALLRDRPVRRLDVALGAVSGRGDALDVTVSTVGLDRLDVAVDGRPRVTVDLDADGDHGVTVPGVDGASALRFEGFSGGALVAGRLVPLP